MPKKKRINLEVPALAWERIQVIQKATEASSTTEVIRRALEVYERQLRDRGVIHE